jgi:hypothetical protein
VAEIRVLPVPLSGVIPDGGRKNKRMMGNDQVAVFPRASGIRFSFVNPGSQNTAAFVIYIYHNQPAVIFRYSGRSDHFRC